MHSPHLRSLFNIKHEIAPVSHIRSKTKLKLALQGGGARGAYSTGFLIALLMDKSIEIVELSGTSAGEKVSLVLADAINQAPSYEIGSPFAIQALLNFWDRMVDAGKNFMWSVEAMPHAASWAPSQLSALFAGASRNLDSDSPNLPQLEHLSMAKNQARMLMQANRIYESWLKSMGINHPLQQIDYLGGHIATSSLRRLISEAVTNIPHDTDPEDRLFVHAASGKHVRVIINTSEDMGHGLYKPHIHSDGQLTLKASMGSSALRDMFHPSIINGRMHWDGAYTENPSLRALIESPVAADAVLMVGTNRPADPEIVPTMQLDLQPSELADTRDLVLHQAYRETAAWAMRLKPGAPTLHLTTYNHDPRWDWTSKQNVSEWHIRGLIEHGLRDGQAALERLKPKFGRETTVDVKALEALAMSVPPASLCAVQRTSARRVHA